MSRKVYHEKTADLPPYGEIFPDVYTEGDKLPVMIFLHGIGELTTKKTIKEAVDFHTWFNTATDKKKFIAVLPQDDGVSLFDDKEVLKMLGVISRYSNGQVCLAGLSRGAGDTLSILMSNSLTKPAFCCYIVLCPPTWEGMNEQLAAASNVPLWIFAGAKDDADTTSHSTRIDRQVNTVDDILRAGRKDNFYFTVFPNDDHTIWPEVMGAIDVPPVTPVSGASEWKGTNTVNGQTIDITVKCVNNPAVSVYDFFLMQHKDNYKPLPLLSDVPDTVPVPTPTPTPTPTPSTPAASGSFKNFIDTRPYFGIGWEQGTEVWKVPTGGVVTQVYTRGDAKLDQQYLVVVYTLNGTTLTKKFGPKKV